MMRALLSALLLLGFVQTAVAQVPSELQPIREPVAAAESKDAAAIRKVAMVLMFTRIIGVTGIEKSPTATGKQLALDVASTSAALLAELKAAAAVSGFASAIPDALEAVYAGQAELLQSSFETQFEHEHLSMQIAAHREVAAALEAARGGLAMPALDGVTRKVSSQMRASLSGLEAAKRALPSM